MNSKFCLIFFFFVTLIINGCSNNPFQEYPLFTTEISVPLLSSPIYSSTEAIGLSSLYHEPIRGKAGEFHSGIDIKFNEGAKVKASALGVVTLVGVFTSDKYGPVTAVRIKYNNKYIINYSFEPAKEIYLSSGDYVEEGQMIGALGVRDVEGKPSSWLHFEVDSFGFPNCPMQFFDSQARQEFRTLYNLATREGLVDPCYEHPNGCPLLHYN